MPVEAVGLRECEEADLSWSDVGSGPYTVRVVDPQNPVPLASWKDVVESNVKWTVNVVRHNPVMVIVYPSGGGPQARSSNMQIAPGNCQPGALLLGPGGATTTIPQPGPTSAPAPASSSASPNPDQATPTSQAGPLASHHDDIPAFSEASTVPAGVALSTALPTKAAVSGTDFATSLITDWEQGSMIPTPTSRARGGDALSTGTGTRTGKGTDTTGPHPSDLEGFVGSDAQQNAAGSNSNSLGPIVGGVAGGIGAALILGVLACYCLRKRSMRRQIRLEDREYHVFTDTSSSASHSLSKHRRSSKPQSHTASQSSRRRTQEGQDQAAYDEKYGYMEELGPTPRQSRYSDGLSMSHLNAMRAGFVSGAEEGAELRAPSLIHLDTESVRSMGVRHILDPKELGRSPSSPKDGDTASVSVRGSMLSASSRPGVGVGGAAAVSGQMDGVPGARRSRWRSSFSAFGTSPILSTFFGGSKSVRPTIPPKGHLQRANMLDRSVDSGHSEVAKHEVDQGGQRFTLTLPTAAERIILPSEQQAGSEQTHQSHTTYATDTSLSKTASRKSTATVRSVKSTKTGRSATTFGGRKLDDFERDEERGVERRQSERREHSRERSRDRSRDRTGSGSGGDSRRHSRATSTRASSPFSNDVEVPPLPTKCKSTSAASTMPRVGDQAGDRNSISAKSVRSITSRASKHVSGLAGLPALQYVDYGDPSDDVPSVPSLPPMPFDDFGAAPALLVSVPTAAAPPSSFPVSSSRPQPKINTDIIAGPYSTRSPSRRSPKSSRPTSRPILTPLSQGRSRAASDATSRMTHDEAGADADADADESEHSCVTVTARRVPVSAVGRVRSGMFERPRTLLMGTTPSTTASMVSQGSSSSMGEAAECERQSVDPSSELSPTHTHTHGAAYAQPAVARHSGLAYLGPGTGAGPAGSEKEKGEEKRRLDLQGPRFSGRWSGWSPSSIGDSETRSGNGHAM